MANRTLNSTMSINFIAFKRAMTSGSKTAGMVKAYYLDFMSCRINVNTFFAALKKLDAEVPFIVKGASANEVALDLETAISLSTRAQFEKRA